MAQHHHSNVFKLTCLVFLLIVLIKGIDCMLTILPSGPSLVNALVGTNVTLAVSYSGAAEPVAVSWKMGSLPVATWTIGDSSPPDIDPNHNNVVMTEKTGSLTLRNVPLNYSNTYEVRMTKSGAGEDTATFTLWVYDIINNVSVGTVPNEATEGDSMFTLYYSTRQGEAKESKWKFNGVELENGSRYSISGKNLTIKQPNRNDTGQYTVVLTNPFISQSSHRNVTVLYGPDEPVLDASPTKLFFVSGESLSLSCQAQGEPSPSASWVFGGQPLATSPTGTLNLTNVKTNQSGIYSCVLVNTKTGVQLERSITLNIYESPPGSPECSVQAVNGNVELQFRCLWPGGAPKAQLSFPALNNTSSGAGDFSVTTGVTQDINGMEVLCMADHPLHQKQCNVTASGPADFIPSVLTTVDQAGKMVVTIECYATAVPKAMVAWLKAGQSLGNGLGYQISDDTMQLIMHNFDLSTTDLNTYTCNPINPLGSKSKDTQLLGPTISDSSLFQNEDGTVVTLTWEVPSTSIVTGFDIRMKGPDLSSSSVRNSSRSERATEEFRTIEMKPASSRRTDVSGLDPKFTYRFRVIPVAGKTNGEPSEDHRIGPGEGLSGPAIVGIAAGIPCSILFLLILIVLCVLCCRKKNRKTQYPISRAVEKAVTTQPNLNLPHNLLTGGLKPPTEYNLHKALPERPGPLPSGGVSPVRMATAV